MTVEKTFGFGNQSPYRSTTFNKNNDLIFGKNGPLQIGSISNDLPNVLLQDITFIQQGMIVKKIGSDTVTFPANLPTPFYLTASVPDAKNVDNIIWGFVRRPQDINNTMALVAEWDGQEWRPLDKLSIQAILQDRLDRAKAYDNLGFNTGFRFSPNDDFSEYRLTRGQVTDKSGRLINKNSDASFDEIPEDADFDRVDAIIWRTLQDSPNRIGFPALKPGNTYSGANLSQVKLNEISDNTNVNSKPTMLVLEDNTYIMFYIEQYGANGKLKAVKYDVDRTTELVAPTEIALNVLDYSVSLGPNGVINIAFVRGSDLLRMRVAQSDLTETISASVIDALVNPVSKPVIKTDYLGNQHIMFLYQQAPTIFSPYYMRLNVGGSIAKPAFRIRANSSNYSKVDFQVNGDLELFAVYSNATSGAIEYQKLDEFGLEITGVKTISDDTYDKENDVVLVGAARNAQIKVSEINTVYITYEQDKGASTYGFCLYAENLLNDTGHKAKLISFDLPTENIEDHKMELDWQEHGHIMYSNGSTLRYYKFWLPSLNSRLASSFEVGSSASTNFDLAYDKTGALLQAFAEEQIGTANNGAPITDFKTGSGTFGGEGVFLAANQIAVSLSDLQALDPVPTIQDSFILSGSVAGNNGTYTITNQKIETIGGTSYTVFTVDNAFSTSVDSPGSELQFRELQGNILYFAKQSSAVSYGFPEVFAEELNADVIAVLIRKSDDAFVTWYERGVADINSPQIRAESSLHSAGDISWDAVLNGGTLTWTARLEVLDPFRGNFYVDAGSIQNFAENEFLYLNLPKSEYFLEDGDTNTIKVVSVAQFDLNKEVFVGDSDSNGIVTTVTAIGIGEITVADNIDAFTKVRGAYVIPIELEIKKSAQNVGALKPSSTGEVDASIFIVAGRKNTLVNFRNSGLTLEDQETGNLGDGVPENIMQGFLNANEGSASPTYTSTNYVTQNNHLPGAISELDTKSQDLQDQVSDNLSQIQSNDIDIADNLSQIQSNDVDISELNKYFELLDIVAHETDADKVRITSAERTLNDGRVISQTLQNLIFKFEGAVIDFTNKAVFESDGVTPLGIDFPEALAIPASQYTWYGIGIIPTEVQLDGRIEGQLLILSTNQFSSTGDPDEAQEPVISGSIPRGAVQVLNNSGDYEVSKIRIFGPGSGSGSGGAGDTTDIEERVKNRLNLTDYKYAIANPISKKAEDLVDDSSTAAYSIVEGNYEFEDLGDIFLSKNYYQDLFLSQRVLPKRFELSLFVDPNNSGEDSTFEASFDGGNNFQAISLNRIGSSDVLRGEFKISNLDLDSYTLDLGGAASTTIDLDNLTDLNRSYVMENNTYVRKFSANITVTGNPIGVIYAEAVLDNGGAPTGDPISKSKFIDIADLATGNVDFDFGYIGLPETAHIVIRTDSLYKNQYDNSSGADKLSVDSDGSGMIGTLTGFEQDLRVRITRGSGNLILEGTGLLYSESISSTIVDGDFSRHLIEFDGQVDNESVFDLNFDAHPRLLFCFEIGTGQVYRYGAQGFLINGQGQIVFEDNTFNKPGTVALEFIQFMGTSVDSSDAISKMLAAANIGSPGDFADFLQPGRGHFFRRPDGTIREIALNDNDELEIYSVD